VTGRGIVKGANMEAADDTITHDVKMTSPANLAQLKQWIVVHVCLVDARNSSSSREAGYE